MTTLKKAMQTYQADVQEYEVREETLYGRTYLAVPVTMMVEGVHQGSHGALLHTAEELGKIPESWNGIPVTLGHPTVDEAPVSANSPQILEEWAVGFVFNTNLNDIRLKSEAWFDKERLLALNENLHDRINNGEIIEVSVGVFSEDEVVEGTWHNEQYVAVARNLRPDHLAILANQTGACSVEDGCGIRVNNSKNMKIDEKNKLEVLQQLRKQGYNVSELVVNESLMQLIQKIRDKVYSMDVSSTQTTPGIWHYVEDVTEKNIIYSVSSDGETKLYKQGYAIAADDTVTFIGEPVNVVKKVEYETVQTNEDTGIKRKRKFNLKKEDDIMANEKCTPCVAKKAGELIANSLTAYVEADREWLETLEEAQLDKMVPKASEPQIEKITPEMAVNALKNGLKGQDDFINLMPTEMQEQTRSALHVFQERKAALIDGIIANTEEGTWTKEELEVYEVAKLEKISKTAGGSQSQANYAGMAAGGINTNATVEDVPFLEPAGIQFKN